MVVNLVYYEKTIVEKCVRATDDKSIKAILNKKLFIQVSLIFIGWKLNIHGSLNIILPLVTHQSKYNVNNP